MANTTKTQPNRMENIKTVKSSVVTTARDLLQTVAKLKQQSAALTDSIRARKAQLVAEEANKAAVVAPVVEPVLQEPVVVEQPKVEPVVETPVEVKKPASQPKPTVEPALQKPAEKPQQKPSQQPAQKPVAQPAPTQPKVSTVVENGREVKTYTDEKGNVKVRKFLDTSAQQRKPAPRQDDRRTGAPQGQGGSRQQGGPRTNGRPNGTPADKGGQTPADKRQQGAKQPVKKPVVAPIDLPRQEPQKSYGNKNKTKERPEEKRGASKKALITRNYTGDYDEDRVVRKARPGKKGTEQHTQVVTQKITHAVITTQEVAIKVLSEKIGVSVSEIIKQLFKEGVMKTINDTVDFDYAEYIASMYDVTLELQVAKTAEEIVVEGEDDGLVDDTKRPPIVTVMGHVDHGKTSLLDAIRNTSVTSGEAGGITQHIGAYTVTANGEPITFIDTPGHAAFTAMRARGAKVTDVAIIVVAADDGVMPQTIEAINHAKAAEVAIIVAINKMDKPHIDPERVKQQLTEYELLAEEWGGDTIMVPVSAKTGMGIDQLLESVLLVTELKELKANPKKRATGTIIESRLDKGRGPVATVLVSNGTLHVGDSLIAGAATGKIRAMFDDKGRKVKSAGPSMPVEVLGFSEVPQAGDYMFVADEKLVKKAAEERKDKIKLEAARQTPAMNLGDLFGRISQGQLKNLNIILKTDVHGSLEALKASLEKISNDEVVVSCIHGGVGGINETDIMLAKASQAIIIGFNVRADSKAKALAETEGVDFRLYSVIYDAIDDITAAMKGMLAPKFREQVTGTVEVREVFKISGVGAVAGCYVTNGKAVRGGKVRVFRNDVSIYEGSIAALKRFKDDVKEVASGYECGISIENYNDIKVGDVFEIYQMEEIAQ